MTKLYRQDTVKVDSVTLDSCGILRAKARIARAGVMDYYEDGKLIRELKTIDELSKALDSFSAQVVTLDHPKDMVDSSNANKYSVGLSGDNAVIKDGWMTVGLTITHQDAIAKAQTTHKQFSNGYWANVVDEAGIWLDEFGVMGIAGKSYEYDRVQKDIVGNHIALVERARAGERATFTDSVDFIIKSQDIDNLKMTQIIYDNQILTIEGSDADSVKSIIDTLKVEIKTKEDALVDAESKLATQSAENAVLTAKVDAASQESVVTDSDAIASEVASRLDAWTSILPHLGTDYKPDFKLDTTDIKRIWLKTALPNLSSKIDSADKAYVDALWDVKPPTQIIAHSKLDELKSQITKDATTPKLDSIEEARVAYAKSRDFTN